MIFSLGNMITKGYKKIFLHQDNVFNPTNSRNYNFARSILEEENVNWDQKGNEYSYF